MDRQECLSYFYSARNAGRSGESIAAQVAKTDAVKPEINTPINNKPRLTPGSCAEREKNTGAIATSAQTVPVTSPQQSSSAFSTITISAK